MTHFYTYESRIVASCVTVSGSVRPATPDITVYTLSQIQICVCGKITQHSQKIRAFQVASVCTFVGTASWKLCGILFSGEFAKLRKASIGVVISVRLYARNTWAPDGRIFVKFHI
jgi:hypothetical protein